MKLKIIHVLARYIKTNKIAEIKELVDKYFTKGSEFIDGDIRKIRFYFSLYSQGEKKEYHVTVFPDFEKDFEVEVVVPKGQEVGSILSLFTSILNKEVYMVAGKLV